MSLPPDIHAHLANYAYTHLTEDYILYTENSVEECTHGLLDYIELHPLNTAARYKDPVDEILSKRPTEAGHESTHRECIDLAFKAPLPLSTAAATMLRQILPQLQHSKSNDDAHFVQDLDDDSSLRPVSPPLRTREQHYRQHPTILPQSWSDMPACTTIHAPNVENADPVISLERTLNIVLPITTAMTDMLRKMLMLREAMNPTNINELFLDSGTMPELLVSERRFSPPVFARNLHIGSGKNKTLPVILDDLTKMNGGDSDILSNSETDDIDEENIRIIGGWRAFTPDSSFILGSSPLASAKTESDIDFSLGSSSNTSGIARLNEIKDTFVIPRTSNAASDNLNNYPTQLSEQLLGSLDPVSEPDLSPLPFSYSPVNENMSTRAINPSALGTGTLETYSNEFGGHMECDVDYYHTPRAKKIFNENHWLVLDPYDIILEAGLNNDADHLMEVPCLPTHSDHGKDPRGYDDGWRGLESDPCMVPVRIKAIELQLTWSPHLYEQSFTDDELCGVDLDIKETVKHVFKRDGGYLAKSDTFERLLEMVDTGAYRTLHDPFTTDEPIAVITRESSFDLLGTSMLLSRSDMARTHPLHSNSPQPPSSDHFISSSLPVKSSSSNHDEARSMSTPTVDPVSPPASPPRLTNTYIVENDLQCDDSDLHDWRPLSFESNFLPAKDLASDPIHQECCVLEQDDISPSPPSHTQTSPLRKVNEFTGIFSFLRLRAPTFATFPPDVPALDRYMLQPRTTPVHTVSGDIRETVSPMTLADSNTLLLPDDAPSYSTTGHTYLASLTTVGKTVLVHHMEAPSTAISLVEREKLDDVDLILDPHTAVLLIPMTYLPAEYSTLAERLRSIAARFTHILLLFECYPSSASYKVSRSTNAATPNCFTPPIIKALRNLRRSIAISLTCEGSMAGKVVMSAFATSPLETAQFARLFGDLAEKRDVTGGLIWGDRSWLSDCGEEEGTLAAAESMNTFCAAVILAGVSLDTFIEGMSPEMRLSHFGSFIGLERAATLNAQLAAREQQFNMMIEPALP